MAFSGLAEQICLVSGQNLPNYMGVCVSDPRPDRVHLLVTSSMQQQAAILENALKRLGCTVQQHPLASANPEGVFNCLCDIGENLQGPAAINVTGGTKLMALTAVEWAHLSELKHTIFYIDTQQDSIFYLSGGRKPDPLSCQLSIAELLLVGPGHTIVSRDKESISETQHLRLQELLNLFLQNPQALKLFNQVASEAQKQGCLYQNWPYDPPASFKRALSIAEELGKVTLSQTITFTSEEARKWCNGGWLEEYVKDVLASMRGKKLIHDYAANVELDYRTDVKGSSKDAVQNEIDAAFSQNSMLYLIECKTSDVSKIIRGKEITRTMAADALYKLDSLKDTLGGTFGKGMVVSVFAPREEDIHRAGERGIRLIYGSELLGLEKNICDWINGK